MLSGLAKDSSPSPPASISPAEPQRAAGTALRPHHRIIRRGAETEGCLLRTDRHTHTEASVNVKALLPCFIALQSSFKPRSSLCNQEGIRHIIGHVTGKSPKESDEVEAALSLTVYL